MAAIDIACPDCSAATSLHVGQSIAPGELVWWESIRCSSCGCASEADGHGIPPPEIRDANGKLVDGGKHYGHLEVRVNRRDDGNWQAVLNPVYLFPMIDGDGELQSFEPRNYDDRVVLEETGVDESRLP